MQSVALVLTRAKILMLSGTSSLPVVSCTFPRVGKLDNSDVASRLFSLPVLLNSEQSGLHADDLRLPLRRSKTEDLAPASVFDRVYIPGFLGGTYHAQYTLLDIKISRGWTTKPPSLSQLELSSHPVRPLEVQVSASSLDVGGRSHIKRAARLCNGPTDESLSTVTVVRKVVEKGSSCIGMVGVSFGMDCLVIRFRKQSCEHLTLSDILSAH